MPVPNLKVRITAISLFAAVAVAGCGGGSSTTSSSADFVAQGNAICKSYNASTKALPQPKTNADIAGYLDKAVPLLDQGTEKLAALTPPSDQQDQFDAWITTVKKQQSFVDQAKTAADGGDIQKTSSLLAQEKALSASSDSQATALGLTECAKEGAAGSSGSSGSS